MVITKCRKKRGIELIPKEVRKVLHYVVEKVGKIHVDSIHKNIPNRHMNPHILQLQKVENMGKVIVTRVDPSYKS